MMGHVSAPGAEQAQSARADLTRRLTLAVATPVALLAVLGVLLGTQILFMASDARQVDHSDEVLGTANEAMLQIIDQETGVRGYLLTGDRLFLEPYQRAHPTERFARLRELVGDSPGQQARFDLARRRHEEWIAWVTPVLQGKNLPAAAANEAMRDGKSQMDGIREAMRSAMQVEEGLRRERVTTSAASTARTEVLFVGLIGLSAAILAFLSRRQLGAIAATFTSALEAEMRSRQEVEAEAWIRASMARVVHGLQGDKSIVALGSECLATLAAATGADVGAFFAREGTLWHRRAGFALDARAAGPETFSTGEGVVGRAGLEGELVRLKDVPAAFLKLRTGTGELDPGEVVLVPATADGAAHAVVELGFIRPAAPRALALLQRVGESIAIAVRSAENRRQLRELLEETQRQTEELQTQQEELRVANEELESQTTALKGTRRELEGQQAELLQTNQDLLEQRQQLEQQNRLLTEARVDIAAKIRDVERASQFKSEFLSNMSHELRTPLNSSLIMAKLLADNRDRNLTAEQVKYADTIYSAGNDLLALINDILDLAKVESGKLEVNPATVTLERLKSSLLRTFEPVANEKHLGLRVTIAESAPGSIETDSHRLEQIMKNLISNALKFTERGEVTVDISGVAGGVAFAVRDTGIGIAAEQHDIIFEAFRQADGTTNRRFGGTGLGLSISRDLARLLGGEITVTSAVGQGSLFVLTLPSKYQALNMRPEAPAASVRAVPPAPPTRIDGNGATNPAPSAAPEEPDLTPGDRFVLIVEDDEAFAQALVTVGQEAGFKSVAVSTGDEGLRLAKKYGPMGIVLDLRLPDYSGLTVLDRLKRDPLTRHIPVHVISAADFTQEALSMGAVAFLLKPVKREQLVHALRTLEARSDHRMRRVLVVEDDTELRESVAKLLARSGVEIETCATAEAALKLLREHTYDCVVTDLAMPGASGYELIETMATEEPYSVPPVIVYTGRALSAEEEQRLRKYSKSIIVKGARSPERLLDEVTLFLHQVESELSPEQQRLLRDARHRDSVFEGRTILVVEDDVRNVFALTSILEPRGARVAIARNGREALAMLEKEPAVDLVLMDIMMPEMDGLEATRAIRQNPAWGKLPIIALTAKAMRDDQERCLAAGANDYLPKPLDIEMLLSLLRVWMPKA